MHFAVCCVPVSPLRIEPSHKSEMISQQLFGEFCTVLEETENWVKVKCKYDNYEGWCQPHHITKIDEELYMTDDGLLAEENVNTVFYDGEAMLIPMGSSLPGLKNNMGDWNGHKVDYAGK